MWLPVLSFIMYKSVSVWPLLRQSNNSDNFKCGDGWAKTCIPVCRLQFPGYRKVKHKAGDSGN